MSKALTHLNQKGEAHIVDVGGKDITARRAVARATLEAKPETVEAIAGAAGGEMTRSRKIGPMRASPLSRS